MTSSIMIVNMHIRTRLISAKYHVEKNRDMVAEWIAGLSAIEWVPLEAAVVGLPRLLQKVDVDPESLYRRLAEEYCTFAVPGEGVLASIPYNAVASQTGARHLPAVFHCFIYFFKCFCLHDQFIADYLRHLNSGVLQIAL